MEKHMYYCRELNVWYFMEYYGWFCGNSDAIEHFKNHIKNNGVTQKKQKWVLGRVLPQQNVSDELITKKILEFESGGKN